MSEGTGSPSPGYQFALQLPAPSDGHPDFVILRSRFDAAVKKAWKPGDRFKVGRGGRRNKLRGVLVLLCSPAAG